MFVSRLGTVRLRKRNTWPQTFAVTKGSRLYFGYGDQATGKRVISQNLRDVPETEFYGDEFLLAIADCAKQTFVVQRDAMSVLPIFISGRPDHFILSNSYLRTYELASQHERLQVNRHALSLLLLGQNATGETLAEAIEPLYDRRRYVWSPTQHHMELPPDGSILKVASQREGDPQKLRAMLEGTLDTYWKRYTGDNIAGCELSCGLDTSAINGYFAIQNHPFHTVSMTYHDEYRDSILHKLALFKTRFGVQSHETVMDISRDFPLANMVSDNKWYPFYHGEGLYNASLEKQADYLKQRGVSVVFQGVGGDELYENIPSLHDTSTLGPYIPRDLTLPSYITPQFQDYASGAIQEHATQITPTPLLANSVVDVALGSNNIYIERGIWPVWPLADARLYLYCQSLPIRYRANRNLMRAYLQARGFPEEIFNPTVNEDFGPFFDAATPRGLQPTYKKFAHSSMLAQSGLVDMDTMSRQWNIATAESVTSVGEDEFFAMYCALVAEINLRYLEM